jgi:hypothetical protein
MQGILKAARPVSFFLTTILIVTTFYSQYASAAMIGTEVVTKLDRARGEEARQYLYSIIAREDVRAALIAQGLKPDEARARVDSLTDSEVIRLAEKIDQLPAGGDALGVILGVALIVFLVLLITDIMGYTDIFPFVKKAHR